MEGPDYFESRRFGHWFHPVVSFVRGSSYASWQILKISKRVAGVGDGHESH